MTVLVPQSAAVRCTPRHKWTHEHDLGRLRTEGGSDEKSRCPGWASDERLQHALMSDALVEADVPLDTHGRPKRIWNAVGGFVFVGLSTNEQAPAYKCFPDYPAVDLIEELERRRTRSVEDIIGARP
jgi:hypothetical protein